MLLSRATTFHSIDPHRKVCLKIGITYQEKERNWQRNYFLHEHEHGIGFWHFCLIALQKKPLWCQPPNVNLFITIKTLLQQQCFFNHPKICKLILCR